MEAKQLPPRGEEKGKKTCKSWRNWNFTPLYPTTPTVTYENWNPHETE